MARASVEAERRGQIVAAAIELVARKGYVQTTIRDIAELAGTSTGTINYYFAGKDDVLASALVEVSERFGRDLDVALAGVEDPAEQLARIADVSIVGDKSQVVWLEFWSQASRSTELRALHARLYDGWCARIAKIVQSGIDAGGFRRVEPALWARQFAAMLDGLGLHATLHSGAVSVQDMRAAARAHVQATLMQ